MTRKAKRGSVTDDMPSPGIVDGDAIGAALDRIRVQRCTTCDRPVATHREETTPRDEQDPAICYFNGGLACHKNEVDWRARALAEKQRADEAEANAASWERLHDLACQNVAHANEEGESAREYIGWSSRKHRDAESIARRALVEGLWECNSLRRRYERIRRLFWSTSGEVGQCDVEAIRTDAARAERELIVAELQARAAENRAAQQGAAIERQAIVADEAGRRAAQLEHLAAFFQRGDHAKGGG